MITIEKEIEKYISDVSSKLLCSKEKKKEIIEDIRGAVFDFAEESGTKDIADIYKHFGTPEELAKVHMSDLDPAQIKKKISAKKIVFWGILITLAMIAFVLFYELIDSHNEIRGTFSEKTTEIAMVNFPVIK